MLLFPAFKHAKIFMKDLKFFGQIYLQKNTLIAKGWLSVQIG
jgi:hypothetical protein